MKILFRVLLLTMLSFAGAIAAMAAQTPFPAEQWRTDLTFLEKSLLAKHPNPFRKVSRTQFQKEEEQLNASLPGLTREQFIVGIMHLVASLGDGHTTVLPGPQMKAGFHVLPFRFYLYPDGLYLDGADRAYAAGLGGRLVSINGVPAAEVIRRVRELTPGDNPSTVDGRLPSYIIVPEVLTGLGVISGTRASVPMTLEIAGKSRTLEVAPIAPPQAHAPPGMTTHYSADWVDRGPKHLPLWLRSANKAYWFEYEPKSATLYLQYNRCDTDPGDPMPGFAHRLAQALVGRHPRRVIVDLRLNSGGEGYWNRALIRALLRSDAASEKGRFFVLIGRQTFSAGSMMAIELEKYARVTFVGEPSGGAIQGFGNHEPVFLPNSGLGVMIATKFYQNDGPNDERPMIVPDVAVSIMPDDYRSGRDPVLAAALAYKAP